MDKLVLLRDWLQKTAGVLVAYSGGADSAFVLKIAHEILGDRAVALIAISPSLSQFEYAGALKLAQDWGVRLELVCSQEIDNPLYAANPTNRCFYCKSELYQLCQAKAAELGLAVIVDGCNLDDTKDVRPGMQARGHFGVRSPLIEIGLTKDEIRALSQQMHLATWDKPASPCLSSRFPYGTIITRERLQQVEKGEAFVRSLGFKAFRVRFLDPWARLEVAETELARALLPEMTGRLKSGLGQIGFSDVLIEPYRRGRLNDTGEIRSPHQ